MPLTVAPGSNEISMIGCIWTPSAAGDFLETVTFGTAEWTFTIMIIFTATSTAGTFTVKPATASSKPQQFLLPWFVNAHIFTTHIKRASRMKATRDMFSCISFHAKKTSLAVCVYSASGLAPVAKVSGIGTFSNIVHNATITGKTQRFET